MRFGFQLFLIDYFRFFAPVADAVNFFADWHVGPEVKTIAVFYAGSAILPGVECPYSGLINGFIRLNGTILF